MYPAMLRIEHRKITVIGGGEVAYRKVKTFLKFNADVCVVAPRYVEQFKTIESEITYLERAYQKEDLGGNFIVVAATDNQLINEEIGLYCNKHNILCNVVDQPKLSSFIVPAHMNRGDLTISISTNGKSPILAKRIKEELLNHYDESYIERLELLGELRSRIVHEEDRLTKEKELKYIAELPLEQLRELVDSNQNI